MNTTYVSTANYVFMTYSYLQSNQSIAKTYAFYISCVYLSLPNSMYAVPVKALDNFCFLLA